MINLRINIFALILSFIHILIVNSFFISFPLYNDLTQKFIYLFLKIFSFVLIIFLYQALFRWIVELKNKNSEVIQYTKYASIGFLVNIIIMMLIFPAVSFFPDIQNTIIHINDVNPYILIPTYININLLYNVIPSLFGIVILNQIIYSVIFAYVIYNSKKYISSKYYKLLYIPFFIPVFLAYNQIPRNLVIASWLFIFVFSYIYFNKEKMDDTLKSSIFFGLLAAYFVNFRAEFFPLIFLLPLLVFIYKMFTNRKFIIFLVSFILMHSSLTVVQNSFFPKDAYKLENFGFIFMTLSNDVSRINQQDLTYIKKLFPNIDKSDVTVTPVDEKEYKKLIFIAKKVLVKNYFYIASYNLNNYFANINNPDFLLLRPSLVENYYPDTFQSSVKLYPTKEKIISPILYGSTDYKASKVYKIFYKMYFNYAIILCLLIGGIFLRKSIYIFISLLLSWICACVIAIGFVGPFIYFYVFLFCSYVFFFMFLADLFAKIKRKDCN